MALKKYQQLQPEEKGRLVEKDNRKVPVARWCELLDRSKSPIITTQ